MSFPVFYFMGGEDVDFLPSPSSSVTTAGGFFLGGVFSRCALHPFGNALSANQGFWSALSSFASAPGSFWFQGYCYRQDTPQDVGTDMLRFCDAAVPRLRVVTTLTGYQVYKQTAAGGTTLLGTLAFLFPTSIGLHKFDIQVVYAVAGSINIYEDNNLMFSYSGDVTTDGATTLNGLQLGTSVFTSDTKGLNWSGVMISDSDTRSMTLQTLAPVANGNTHTFDVGSPAAGNVNEITINDATLDGASAAALIDQYTIPAIAAGSYAVAAVSMTARLMRSYGGPTRCDLGVRSGGADWWGAHQTLNYSFTSGYRTIWNVDPATSAAWSGLPTNIGLLAVA